MHSLTPMTPDYIESFDFFESDWIRTGLKEDRLIYRHPFNERTRKWLFYRFYELQKRMGWQRAIPADLQVMIGSQWWCLRRRTIEAILHFCDMRRDILRWFRTTWVPDETFFQTLVRHLVSEREIRCRTLTFLTFTDYGMPACFYDDQYDLLVAQNYLFARKISPGARQLKAQLGALYTAGGATFAVSNEGSQAVRLSERARPDRAAICAALLGGRRKHRARKDALCACLQEMACGKASCGRDPGRNRPARRGICLQRRDGLDARAGGCRNHPGQAQPSSQVDGADDLRLLPVRPAGHLHRPFGLRHHP